MVDGPSTIHEWFPDFIRRHAERCPSQGWPDLPVLGVTPSEATSAFFNPWITRFTREGVSKAAAETASESLASVDVPWPGPKHLDMLMKHVHSAWDVLRARGAGGPELSSREECQARSRGCPECSGQGFTSRMKTIEDYPIPVSMAFFCMCPSGEWMANLYYHEVQGPFRPIPPAGAASRAMGLDRSRIIRGRRRRRPATSRSSRDGFRRDRPSSPGRRYSTSGA
jgi:hypothetical protein